MHRPTHWLLLTVLLLAPSAAVSAKSVSPQKAALIAQWADLPDYAHLLESGLRFKVPPRLISGAPPNPPDFLLPNATLFVQVLVAIDERGHVAEARVARSDDARLDALAVESILTWKFTPAEDAIGPVKSLVQLPVQFDGPPAGEQHTIVVNLGPFSYDADRQEISAPILLTGPAVAEVKAARALVESAVDDTGAELSAKSLFVLAPAMVGRSATQSPLFGVSLRKPTPGARTLRSLSGTIELVIPSLDPDAVVQIDQLPDKLGQPVSSPALAAAGITLIVLNRKICEQALADASDATGIRAFLTLSSNTSTPVWKYPAGVGRMNSRDLALAIHDPQRRLAGVEFQTMYGNPLNYNRKGLSHFSVSKGKKFSIYRMPAKLTDDTKLVCWLITPKSRTTYPLQVTNVPLPTLAGAP